MPLFIAKTRLPSQKWLNRSSEVQRKCSPLWIALTTLGTTSMQVAEQAPPHFLWSAGSYPTCFFPFPFFEIHGLNWFVAGNAKSDLYFFPAFKLIHNVALIFLIIFSIKVRWQTQTCLSVILWYPIKKCSSLLDIGRDFSRPCSFTLLSWRNALLN